MIQRGYLNIEGEVAGEPPGGIGKLKWMVLSTFNAAPQPLTVKRFMGCRRVGRKLSAAAAEKIESENMVATLAGRSALTSHLFRYCVPLGLSIPYSPGPHCAASGSFTLWQGNANDNDSSELRCDHP